MGEVNREEQVGIKFRYNERTRQEKIVLPSEWQDTNIASTGFEKDSFNSCDEETCRGKEEIGIRVEKCKKFCGEKELVDRELHSRFEKEEEEVHRCEKLKQGDIESKEQ